MAILAPAKSLSSAVMALVLSIKNKLRFFMQQGCEIVPAILYIKPVSAAGLVVFVEYVDKLSFRQN